jgi:hypothetical protein
VPLLDAEQRVLQTRFVRLVLAVKIGPEQRRRLHDERPLPPRTVKDDVGTAVGPRDGWFELRLQTCGLSEPRDLQL